MGADELPKGLTGRYHGRICDLLFSLMVVSGIRLVGTRLGIETMGVPQLKYVQGRPRAFYGIN